MADQVCFNLHSTTLNNIMTLYVEILVDTGYVRVHALPLLSSGTVHNNCKSPECPFVIKKVSTLFSEENSQMLIKCNNAKIKSIDHFKVGQPFYRVL